MELKDIVNIVLGIIASNGGFDECIRKENSKDSQKRNQTCREIKN